MKLISCIALFLVVLALQADADGAPGRGSSVYRGDFDTAESRQPWSADGFARWDEGYQGSTSLCISVPADQEKSGHSSRMALDLTPYRGCRLLFSCVAKAENVSKPSAPYLGVKFMLYYNSVSSGPVWINENDIYGTFDWRPLSFSAKIADDAVDGAISLGMQDSSGTAWFDAVKITVLSAPIVRPAPMANPPAMFRGHDLPRLRGVMSPNAFRDEDLRVLATEWKANVIRWQLTRNWGQVGTERDLAEYDTWFEGKLAVLDKTLVLCGELGVKVVVDMHSPPGGRYANKDMAIFFEQGYQDHWVALWEKIARRYKGNKAIWGYDLINEPVQSVPSTEGVADYLAAQVRAARAIRAIDAEMPIFIESAQWDSAKAYEEMEAVDVPNVIYQVHMYVPGEFTHQGVHGDWKAVSYPGTISGEDWNKERIRKELQPVRDFQLAYNVHIYVGEFSAIRWAPGAADYLRDCIEVFEEYGWDWSYHAYREWDGWSVEHGSDPKDHTPAAQPTDRKQLLLEWYAKNVKPAAVAAEKQ